MNQKTVTGILGVFLVCFFILLNACTQKTTKIDFQPNVLYKAYTKNQTTYKDAEGNSLQQHALQEACVKLMRSVSGVFHQNENIVLLSPKDLVNSLPTKAKPYKSYQLTFDDLNSSHTYSASDYTIDAAKLTTDKVNYKDGNEIEDIKRLKYNSLKLKLQDKNGHELPIVAGRLSVATPATDFNPEWDSYDYSLRAYCMADPCFALVHTQVGKVEYNYYVSNFKSGSYNRACNFKQNTNLIGCFDVMDLALNTNKPRTIYIDQLEVIKNNTTTKLNAKYAFVFN